MKEVAVPGLFVATLIMAAVAVHGGVIGEASEPFPSPVRPDGVPNGPDGWWWQYVTITSDCPEGGGGEILVVEGSYPLPNHLEDLSRCRVTEILVEGVYTNQHAWNAFLRDLQGYFGPLSACDDSVDCARTLANACEKHGGVMKTFFDRSSDSPCEGRCNDNQVVRVTCVKVKPINPPGAPATIND